MCEGASKQFQDLKNKPLPPVNKFLDPLPYIYTNGIFLEEAQLKTRQKVLEHSSIGLF